MKKILTPVLIGILIFITGVICFSLEIESFSKINEFTSSFPMEEVILEYNISEEDVYKITSSGIDNNVNLYIDNGLANKIKIVVSHPVITSIDYEYISVSDDNNYIELDFDSSLNVDFNSLEMLFNLFVDGVRNKIQHDYDLIEYPTINVYVHEQYKDNVKFVGRYGKVYNQIR